MHGLTYKDAGVDIEEAGAFKVAVSRIAGRSYTEGVRLGIGGFAAIFAPTLAGLERPVLVSSTDGVGTKLKIAFETGIHNTVGIDLVAMCVNDILTTGAKPLFFLDYLATGRLQRQVAEQVIHGIVEGCIKAGCALIGGETAEMPDFYAQDEYDLAGFAVGIADESRIVDGSQCKVGDVLLGLQSSGLHSNGFSLVRKVLKERSLELRECYGFERPLGEVLLTPTRIYVKPVLALCEKLMVKAMAHITGGGIPGNLPRVLPKGICAKINRHAIPRQRIFEFIQGNDIPDDEMWKVFNMGVGFILVVAPEQASEALELLETMGEKPFVIGNLEEGEGVVWA